MDIQIDAERASRIISQVLREEKKILPADANELATSICRRLSVVTPLADRTVTVGVRSADSTKSGTANLASEENQAPQIVLAAEKLLSEISRLRRDIQKLHARIEPFEDEAQFLAPPTQALTTLGEAFAALSETRRAAHGAEYHLNAIRAAMDSIAKDAIARSEMKPYLKD